MSQTAVIIGGGVVGLAIANELASKYDVFLLEKENNLGEHQSTRNSGVNHAGLYYPLGSQKALRCVEGNAMLYSFCQEFGIPHLKTGKIVVATDDSERATLERLLSESEEKGVPLRPMASSEISEMEPNIKGTFGLYASESGILDVTEYIKTLAALSEDKGAYLLTSARVLGIEDQAGTFQIQTEQRGVIEADMVINAAGLHSATLASMINPDNSYKLSPTRGEYARIHRPVVSRNVYPTPTPGSLGVHFTPTLDGGILVGPSAIETENIEDYSTRGTDISFFADKIKKFAPGINASDLRLDPHVGIQARILGNGDFVIKKDQKYDNCVHLVGIGSPGITAALSIAKYVGALL